MARDPEQERDYQDQLLCKLALNRGLLSVRQLKSAFNERQKEILDGKLHPRSLVSVLLDEGVLTNEQLRKLQDSLAASTPRPALPRFGPYELGPEIGRGPRGGVFEATDTRDGSRVALKILAPPPTTDPQFIQEAGERFVRETRRLVALPPFPGVVRVVDAGVVDGLRYLASELLKAKTLSEWRRTGAMSIRLQVSMLRDVALAIHHAHRHGVSHRNLKPENILVDGANRPHVCDFGLAHASGEQATITLGSGATAGAIAYLSPEEMRGEGHVDRRADIYSLGVLLYEVIAGRKPFEGAAPFELVERTLNESIVPPSRVTTMVLNPMVFSNLESICLIALARDPARRYADAQSIADDLTRWLTGEEKKSVVPKGWRALRARKIPLGLAAAFAAGILTAAIGTVWLTGGAPERAPERNGNGLAGEMGALAPPVAYRAGAVREAFAGLAFNAPGPRGIDRRAVFADEGRRAWPGQFVSVRWEALLEIERAGTYEFVVESADGVRLFVDGRDVVSNWTAHPPSADWGRIELERGFHPFRLDYFHSGSERLLKVAWKRAETKDLRPLGPGSLFHDPSEAAITDAPAGGGAAVVPGAREAESLEVLGCSGVLPEYAPFAPHAAYREGTWSGPVHLRWGRGVREGAQLRVGFISEAPSEAVILSLTRGPDHGIYRVSVNGMSLPEAMDLYAPRLSIGEVRLEVGAIREGFNEIGFSVVGANPEAVEWTPGAGARMLGLDYVRVP